VTAAIPYSWYCCGTGIGINKLHHTITNSSSSKQQQQAAAAAAAAMTA
jgi:hypothetical protein